MVLGGGAVDQTESRRGFQEEGRSEDSNQQ
jgi:hypothetical protein